MLLRSSAKRVVLEDVTERTFTPQRWLEGKGLHNCTNTVMETLLAVGAAGRGGGGGGGTSHIDLLCALPRPERGD